MVVGTVVVVVGVVVVGVVVVGVIVVGTVVVVVGVVGVIVVGTAGVQSVTIVVCKEVSVQKLLGKARIPANRKAGSNTGRLTPAGCGAVGGTGHRVNKGSITLR